MSILPESFSADHSPSCGHETASTTPDLGLSPPLSSPAFSRPKIRHSSSTVDEDARLLRPHNLRHALPKPLWRYLYYNWKAEVAAAVGAFACIAGICSFLRFVSGRDVAWWRVIFIINAPNTVMSYLATPLKTAILYITVNAISQLKWLYFKQRHHTLNDLDMFENASRGPSGAWKLLKSASKSRASLASLAAMITIISLLLDPALQSTLSYRVTNSTIADLDRQGTFQVAFTYDPSDLPSSGEVAIPAAGNVNAAMQEASLRGIFNAPAPPLSFCPEQSCYWPNVTTLGICSTCREVQESTTSVCTQMPPTVATGRISTTTRATLRCDYTFADSAVPLHASAGGEPDTWADMRAHEDDLAYTIFTSTAQSNAKQASMPEDISKTAQYSLADFYSLRFNEPHMLPDGNPELSLEQAMHCTFYICSKTYNNVEAPVGSNPMPPPTIKALNVTPQIYTTRKAMLELVPSDGSPASVPHFINLQDFGNMGAYIGQFLNGTWLNGSQYEREPHQVMQQFASQPDTPKMIAQVADTMSEAIRTSVNSTLVRAETKHTYTKITVQWEWLLVPIALLLGTCFLLGATIYLTYRNQVKIWKTSNVALLSYDLDNVNVDVSGASNAKELSKLVKDVSVRIEDSDHELAFVRQYQKVK